MFVGRGHWRARVLCMCVDLCVCVCVCVCVWFACAVHPECLFLRSIQMRLANLFALTSLSCVLFAVCAAADEHTVEAPPNGTSEVGDAPHLSDSSKKKKKKKKKKKTGGAVGDGDGDEGGDDDGGEDEPSGGDGGNTTSAASAKTIVAKGGDEVQTQTDSAHPCTVPSPCCSSYEKKNVT